MHVRAEGEDHVAERLEDLRDGALHLRGGGARGRVEVPRVLVELHEVLQLRQARALRGDAGLSGGRPRQCTRS